MNRHWKGVLTIILLASLAFAVAMGSESPLWALLGVVVAIVIGYVMAIDWMRPRKPSNVPPTDGRVAPPL
ncbi:MAG: hypothetical protein ACOY0T_06205 [Myxococcota bacterium]